MAPLPLGFDPQADDHEGDDPGFLGDVAERPKRPNPLEVWRRGATRIAVTTATSLDVTRLERDVALEQLEAAREHIAKLEARLAGHPADVGRDAENAEDFA